MSRKAQCVPGHNSASGLIRSGAQPLLPKGLVFDFPSDFPPLSARPN